MPKEESKAVRRLSVSDVFSELLILGPYLKDARDLGSCESLRHRLLEMFHKAERQGTEAGIPQDMLSQARYAVTAFIDEMVLNSQWAQKDQWSARPLQYEFFREYVAGVEFFKRLEQIRTAYPVPIELLEVYALCLILGFEGQYRVEGRERLKGLTEDVVREIQAKREEMPSLAPHGRRPEELLEAVKQQLPIWVIVVSSLGLIFFFHLALTLIINHDANTVVHELKQLILRVPL